MESSADFFALLHKHAEFCQAEAWHGAVINRVEVYPSQRLWRLSVEVRQPIKTSLLEETIQHLQGFMDGLQVELCVQCSDDATLRDMMGECWQDIISLLGSNAQSVSWAVENCRLDLIIDNEEYYNQLLENGCCQRISSWFRDNYGLMVICRVKLEATLQKNQGPAPTLIPVADIQVLNYDTTARAGKKTFSAAKARRKFSPVRIADLQEGQQNIKVEGQLWQKEMRPIRGGRRAGEYYLTDFLGSVIVKQFLDKPEDDKTFPGQWMSAAGDGRYDPFAKEAVLFAVAIDNIETPQRLDEAPVKRLELHAHTKMSAVDGLAEVEQLVARAAKWGHPAIAITDHGCVQAFLDAYNAAAKHHTWVI